MLVRDEDYSILLAEVFDVYGIDEEKKSVAISIKIQPLKKVFSKAELDEIYQNIVDGIIDRTGATLRS